MVPRTFPHLTPVWNYPVLTQLVTLPDFLEVEENQVSSLVPLEPLANCDPLEFCLMQNNPVSLNQATKVLLCAGDTYDTYDMEIQ